MASLGTGFTANQAGLLERYCRRVALNFDADDAGLAAAPELMIVIPRTAEAMSCILQNMHVTAVRAL